MKQEKMKPFDLEKAKAGAPVCTRDGRKVRILAFDVKSEPYPIVGVVSIDAYNSESVRLYTLEGRCSTVGEGSGFDLMMATEKKKGWMALFNVDGLPDDILVMTSNVYASEEEVKKFLRDMRGLCPAADQSLIEIRQIEWEE